MFFYSRWERPSQHLVTEMCDLQLTILLWWVKYTAQWLMLVFLISPTIPIWWLQYLVCLIVISSHVKTQECFQLNSTCLFTHAIFVAILGASFFFWWMWTSGWVMNVHMRLYMLCIHNSPILVHMHQKKKIAPKIAAKNGEWWKYAFINITVFTG